MAQLVLIAGAGPFLIWKASGTEALSSVERIGSISALGAAALLLFV
jgi:hypothetical protein